MKRARTSILLIILLIVSSCIPKTLPPELKPAYTANEVLIRIHELQNVTIGLYDSTPRVIEKDKADLIVKFTVSSATIIKSSLSGWQASIKQSWIELNKAYTPTSLTLLTIWNIVDMMIGALE